MLYTTQHSNGWDLVWIRERQQDDDDDDNDGYRKTHTQTAHNTARKPPNAVTEIAADAAAGAL